MYSSFCFSSDLAESEVRSHLLLVARVQSKGDVATLKLFADKAWWVAFMGMVST